MLGFRPVIILIKFPVPVLSEVFESDVVGPGFVLQQTPRADTAAPSELTLPPDQAEYCVTTLDVVVVNTGAETTGGSFFVPVFEQEIIAMTRRTGKKNVSLILIIKDTPRLRVEVFMLVGLGVDDALGIVLSNLFLFTYFNQLVKGGATVILRELPFF